MNRFQLTIILTFLTCFAIGQTLVVRNANGKGKRKIKIGKVMTVITKDDSVASPFSHETDSTRRIGYYCPDGCFRLVSINVENNSFTIARDTVLTDFKVEDVKYIRYVRAWHPHRIHALRVALATIGLLTIVGRTITIGDSDSNETKLAEYLFGSVLIGTSVIISSNIPKRYKLVGVEK